jgi:hypothetical protein
MRSCTWVLTAISLCLIVGLGITLFPIRSSDYALYDALMAPCSSENTKTPLVYSQQRREEVCKQIWLQDSSPLYCRIDSEKSELFFFRKNHKIEVVEQLGKVTCVMQEELYFEGEQPMQRVCYLEAEQACYNYNSHLFVAESVELWKIQLEGHMLPTEIEKKTPLLYATAGSLAFSLERGKFDFTAEQFKATLTSVAMSP